ncbi:hypothetical protein J3E71DRAFT_362257 [Bipolaris maydis]|nr:hypothetical protein J3E71DRAFT_362257 [Bipolaris maydis]
MRNWYSLHRSKLSLVADSCCERQSDTDSFSDTYSDPDTEAETDIDIKPSTGKDDGFTMQQESEADLDSEAEEVLKDIAQLRAEGPAKPNNTPHTVKLWKREGEFWERYCFKIMKKTKRFPEEQLRRKKHSRVKKESSMRSYWKRISIPLHSYIRVQISLLLLLSAATATRPGAIVESASAKGSNNTIDPSRSTIIVNVNLENVKNKEKD